MPPNSPHDIDGYNCSETENCSLDCIPSTIDCAPARDSQPDDVVSCCPASEELKTKGAYFRNSIECKLVALGTHARPNDGSGKSSSGEEDDDSELDLLLNLCDELDEAARYGVMPRADAVGGSVRCPLCGIDISNLCEEQRHLHTNDCLDRVEDQAQDVRYGISFLIVFQFD